MQTVPERVARRSAIVPDAHQALRTELLEALTNNPEQSVRTPGWGKPQHTAQEVVADQLDGDSEALRLLLKIVVDASNGVDVTLVSSVWLASVAHRHAAWHSDDLAVELEGDRNGY